MSNIAPASLIMTVLNEEKGLSEFLRSIDEQTIVPAEIVVVDGGSRDATVEILESWAAPRGCYVVVERVVGAGISEGRNRAISRATHHQILVTDAGTRLDSKWVENMLAGFPPGDASVVVSGFFRPTGDTFMERVIAFTVTPSLNEIDTSAFLPSSRSLAFTRDVWEAVGGYPEWLDYCEDLVFDLKIKKRGVSFVFRSDAIVTWSARASIRAFMKQYYRYARGDGKAQLWSKRHGVRYAAYAGGVGLLALTFVTPFSWLALATGFAAYQWKFFRRVWERRDVLGGTLLPALAIAPVIVVAGDLAKMVGYPVGLRWRASRSYSRADY